MNIHEEKEPTCAGARSIVEGSKENAHTGTAGGEGTDTGGVPKEKVARKKNQHYPAFVGGEVFARLTLTSFSHKQKGQHYWNCVCICGKEAKIRRSSLLAGTTTSCGCRNQEVRGHKTHGESHGKNKTLEWNSWLSMIQRCENPRAKEYPCYGGRGIKIDPKWRASYAAFLEDMGRRPTPEHTLDRIDVNGNYEPGNCRWSDWKGQGRNRRNNIMLTYKGVTACLPEWADKVGLTRQSLVNRLLNGWTLQRALETPLQKRK